LFAVILSSFSFSSRLNKFPSLQRLSSKLPLVEMKSLAIITTLLGLALATPIEKRQDLPIDQYNDIPVLPDVGAPVGDAAPVETASYDPTSVAAEAVAIASNTNAADNVIAKRDGAPCTTRSYNGPRVAVPTDDPVAFQSYAPFAASATAAAQATAIPSGYAVVPDSVNLKAAIQDSHYLTYTTKDLSDYEPDICAAKCNAMAGCVAFNICEYAISNVHRKCR
jgi:hypothetical protein